MDKLDIPVFLCGSGGKTRERGDEGFGADGGGGALFRISRGAPRHAHLHRQDEFLKCHKPRGILPDDFLAERRITWVEGFDLVREESVLVPANAVFYPFRREVFKPGTNAAGNTLEGAVCHATAWRRS